jgi:hypothetical protein
VCIKRGDAAHDKRRDCHHDEKSDRLELSGHNSALENHGRLHAAMA